MATLFTCVSCFVYRVRACRCFLACISVVWVPNLTFLFWIAPSLVFPNMEVWALGFILFQDSSGKVILTMGSAQDIAPHYAHSRYLFPHFQLEVRCGLCRLSGERAPWRSIFISILHLPALLARLGPLRVVDLCTSLGTRRFFATL